MTIEQITEKAKTEDVIYMAIAKVLEPNEDGVSEMDKLIKWETKFKKGFPQKPKLRSARKRKYFENDKKCLEDYMAIWFKIRFFADATQMEKETLALILYYVDEIENGKWELKNED